MKLTLQHFEIRSTHTLDASIENQIISLQPRLHIDEAIVRLGYEHESSPSYTVHIHLVTPGPDVFAEARDHTLNAAITKVMRELDLKITHRLKKQSQRLKTNLSKPILNPRIARAA